MKNFFIKLCSVAVLAALCFSAVCCSQATEVIIDNTGAVTTDKSMPLTIGHRGYSGEYPENTVYAFEGAVQNGFAGFECDIWESDYGTLMIHHDSTINRMTGKDGYIWDVNSKNRTDYPIIYGANIDKYPDNSVLMPTLTETLKIVKQYNCYFILHIKKNPLYKMSKKGREKTLRLLKKYCKKSKTLIIGRKSNVKPFIGKGFKIGLTIDPKDLTKLKSEIKWCRQNNVKYLVPLELKDMQSAGSLKKFVKYCNKYNLNFGLYTTPDNKTYNKLADLGAKFAMSDGIVAE